MGDTTPSADAAYQGRPGAYSEAAAYRLCGQRATLLPCDTLAEAFDACASGRARCAVVPVENSIAGAVPGALALLFDSHFVVHAEAIEPIDHVLAAPPGATISGLQQVHSHPVALAQCQGFFRRHPHLAPVPVFDTAGALEQVIRQTSLACGAIVSRAAVARYDATILAEQIQDCRENYTRFLQVGPPPAPPPVDGPCRLLLAARTTHRPGALAALLQAIAAFDINLTRIDSRPVSDRPFEYEFLLEALVPSPATATRLLGCDREPGTSVRVLGCVAAPLTVGHQGDPNSSKYVSGTLPLERTLYESGYTNGRHPYQR